MRARCLIANVKQAGLRYSVFIGINMLGGNVNANSGISESLREGNTTLRVRAKLLRHIVNSEDT